MEPWLDDLADDLQSMSFNSTNTTTTATDIHRSTSSGSETTWTAASSSVSHLGPAIAAAAAKPHTPSGNPCWDAIRRARSASSSGQISLPDLRFIHRLGSGDIGSVYLAELKCGAINGEAARTDKEILEMLDHPFLPTLYVTLESPRWSCLLTEFCPGGDLHVLHQRQPCNRRPKPRRFPAIGDPHRGSFRPCHPTLGGLRALRVPSLILLPCRQCFFLCRN